MKRLRKLNLWLVLWSGVFLVAFLLRFLGLGLKPIHFDESINGFFVGEMWRQGFYRYNPENFHGPLYFYLIQLSELIFGFGLKSLRWVSVVFSIGTLLLFFDLRKILGRRVLWGALFFALSPGFVYYGKTAIHEMTFVWAQVLMFYGWLRWQYSDQRVGVWYFFAGFSACLMLKETSVIFFAAFAIAALVDILIARKERLGISSVKKREVLEALALSCFVIYVVYSGFFSDPGGPIGLLKSLLPWLKEGVGNSHAKPFAYYLKLLWRYEDGLFLALVAFPFLYLKSRERLLRMVLLLSFLLLLIYSLIPYKTPWLLLSAAWPLFIVLGELIERSLAFVRGKILWRRALISCLVILIAISSVKTLHLNWVNYENEEENYVYVQTKKSFSWIHQYLRRLEKERPYLRESRVVVITKEAWPLPYIFRQWSNLHWYEGPHFQEKISADMVFCEERESVFVRKHLKDDYFSHIIDVRGGREKMRVFIKDDPRFLPLPPSDLWQEEVR